MKNSTLIKSKRLEWVDIAKGIAILLMIVGHEVKNVNLLTLIFSFHMPLFFILSGYTSSRVDSWAKFVKKSKKSFIRIWLLAVVMVVLLGIEYAIFSKGSLNLIVSNVLKGIFWGSNVPQIGIFCVGIMWFLFVFFWSKIIFDFMQVIFKSTYIGIILLILSAIAYFFCNGFRHYLPQALDIVPFAALFMWCGSIAKNISRNVPPHCKHIVLAASLIFWLVCVVMHLHIEMSMRSYPLFLICIIEAICGTLLVCQFSKYLLSLWSLKYIQIIGQQTLILMCIHHLDLYWVNWGTHIKLWIVAVIVRLLIDLIILFLYLSFKRNWRKYTNL